MAAQLEVLISVDTDEPDEISDIAARLTAAGLDVSAVHDAISVITGKADENVIGALQRVPGVVEVERQRTVHVAPPGGDVQ
ncbi:hypothetical protein [Thermocrispum municipale]|uniref:hypothetical protein n=1 Tax=Thermocrispum municipale TaxID=37926 RepID=UPI000426E711|nr:hypothetical protein [Thermocrispum municipale]